MITISMTVAHDDGRQVPMTVKPVNQVAFERHFKMSFAAAFSDNPSFEHIYWVAWHAARSGVEFDVWLDTVSGIDIDVMEPVDPTHQAASATP